MITRTEMEQWVAALRSGDYEQGAGYLCSVEDGAARYCCMGVLAEVLHGKNDWEDVGYRWSTATGWSAVLASRTYSNFQFLPEPILGSYRGNRVGGILARKNDAGTSFKEIADWIDQTFDQWQPVAPEPH